jgi:tetratricopeptide (TPR) repeat protein
MYLNFTTRKPIMEQTQVLESISAYLASIGKPHPSLPSSSNPLVSPSQFVSVFEEGCNALNISSNPWAKAEDKGNDEVSSMPVFKQFIEKITKQGYFDACPDPSSEEHKERYAKALQKFTAKLEKKKSAKKASKEDAQAHAVELKNKGNACLNKQAFGDALEFYKQAIDACSDGPSSHIFYANAAASLIHLERYEEAAEMCALSIALKDDYSKSHTRLGYAKIQMNDPTSAITSLERALVLAPGNALATKHLSTARNMTSGLNVPSGGNGGGQPMGGGGGPGGGMAGKWSRLMWAFLFCLAFL